MSNKNKISLKEFVKVIKNKEPITIEEALKLIRNIKRGKRYE